MLRDNARDKFSIMRRERTSANLFKCCIPGWKDLAKTRARALMGVLTAVHLHAESVCPINGTHFSISIPFHILPTKSSKKARVRNSGYFIFVFRLRVDIRIACTWRFRLQRNRICRCRPIAET